MTLVEILITVMDHHMVRVMVVYVIVMRIGLDRNVKILHVLTWVSVARAMAFVK